jgi:ubiquitin-protein ligase E3 C
MFQTFSGTSRRPRQVNLSGQNTNPFGTQHAVAAAQHERQIRQQERDRLAASKKIQRIWRGHKVREVLAESRRSQWDNSQADLPKQLMLLMTFFSPRREDDIKRLEHVASQICHEDSFLSRSDLQVWLPRLATITLQALESTALSYQNTSITSAHTLLGLLIAILDHRIAVFPRISQSYYHYLTNTLLPFTQEGSLGTDLVKLAIRAPLVEHVEQNNREEEIILEAYTMFALQFLTQPNPLGLSTTPLTDRSEILAHMRELASFVNLARLSTALIHIFANGDADLLPSDSKLCLLSHFIGLHRIQHGIGQEPEFLRALSLQLSSSSAEIIRRIDFTDKDVDENNDSMALDPVIKEELLSLVEKHSK